MSWLTGLFQKISSIRQRLWKQLEKIAFHDLPPEVLKTPSERRLPAPKDELGIQGEAEAVRYLKQRHYQILHQNLRLPSCEIDLIAWKPRERTLCFIEVKTRHSRRFGEPYEAVNRKRRLKMIAAAREYLHFMKPGPNIPVQFDIISIIWPLDQKPEIEHIEKAFHPHVESDRRFSS